MDWYALFVETGKEDLVRRLIHKFFDETAVRAIVPKRKLEEKRQGQTFEICKTMFPSYVLLNTKMDVQTYYDLKQIPGYYRLLNKYYNHDIYKRKKKNNSEDHQNDYLFSKINNDEISLILQLIDNKGMIDYSHIYTENARVTVCEGPLKGKEGMIKKIDKRKKRARIVLQFIGNEISMDVGIKVLEPLEIRIK
ncbi:antiterminator LoaP [Paenibacillus sp. GSMTC-2017]|uniref:antiterminator LoaP n=1 Tax=Paenibacillus sp. GSMTC-2017 TaxID=2794350 RepID=UPI0018D9E451|nr:antiterminator LoaP [Paenibacillus sp. GSMTC-2017]MBH5316344.1 antiterminator LoaP [Paenibacillus sp. GSMTC-2017]